MPTFAATADSSDTIGYAYYFSNSWNTGSSSGACQGAYQKTSASYSRVGMMVFEGAGEALLDKAISQITLTIKCASAGSGSSSKVLTFCKARHQGISSYWTGGDQVGDVLGTLTGKFYGNTTTHVLSKESNPGLFAALCAYLAEGNSAVVLYNGETSSSSSYSTNYARVNSCTMTVTYMDATVWYRDNGEWKQCTAWYRKEGAWVRCILYYCRDGTWIRV